MRGVALKDILNMKEKEGKKSSQFGFVDSIGSGDTINSFFAQSPIIGVCFLSLVTCRQRVNESRRGDN